jgi:hypothetical protein
LKYHIARQAIADFLCDAEATGGRFPAAFFRPDPEPGRGYRIIAKRHLVFHHGKALIADRDVDIFHFWLDTRAKSRIKAISETATGAGSGRRLHQIGSAIESGYG